MLLKVFKLVTIKLIHKTYLYYSILFFLNAMDILIQIVIYIIVSTDVTSPVCLSINNRGNKRHKIVKYNFDPLKIS